MPAVLISGKVDLSDSLLADDLVVFKTPFNYLVTLLLLSGVNQGGVVMLTFLVATVLKVTCTGRTAAVSTVVLKFFLMLFLCVLATTIATICIPRLFPAQVHFHYINVMGTTTGSKGIFVPLFVTFLLTRGRRKLVCMDVDNLTVTTVMVIVFFNPRASRHGLQWVFGGSLVLREWSL